MKDFGNILAAAICGGMDALLVLWMTDDKNLAIVTFVLSASIKRESLKLEDKIEGKK